jgi:hypothetical protein
VTEDTNSGRGPTMGLVARETACGAEIRGKLHLHRCIKSNSPGHLHLCYCGAFWPLEEFERIATESARDLYEALL